MRYPPTSKKVGLWKEDTKEAPVYVTDGSVNVCFYYSQPVVVLVGILDNNFQNVWWLNSDCQFTSRFSTLLNGSEQKVCENVRAPVDSGWILWLVAPGNISNIHFDTGPYHLYFYQFGEVYLYHR